jgi:hypothetical protein
MVLDGVLAATYVTWVGSCGTGRGRLTDPTVFRPGTGQWWVLRSSTLWLDSITYSWGGPDDTPPGGWR